MLKTLEIRSKIQKILGLVMCASTLALVTGVTGCAGDRYNQSTGEHIDDRATTSRVKSALSNDPDYKYSSVNVTTFKGTVQLSGFVDTHTQKSRAGDIARHVEGVHTVQNNITVK
jgi:hyperosmotically inducible periplasmic protein